MRWEVTFLIANIKVNTLMSKTWQLNHPNSQTHLFGRKRCPASYKDNIITDVEGKNHLKIILICTAFHSVYKPFWDILLHNYLFISTCIISNFSSKVLTLLFTVFVLNSLYQKHRLHTIQFPCKYQVSFHYEVWHCSFWGKGKYTVRIRIPPTHFLCQAKSFVINHNS